MTELEKVEIIEVLETQEEEKPTKKTKTEICKVKFAYGGFVYFIFDGDTLREPQPTSFNKDSVTVTYVGTYRKSGFKVIRIE